MRPFAPIIATLVLVVASTFFQVGCSSPPEMVLESDIPNVQGLEPIITRDIQRSGEQVDAVEVLYRGDITATQFSASQRKYNCAQLCKGYAHSES
ncbi:MAG: hypothetical protein NTY97_03570 [Planctomycetota bacterium]|nr:hypothetical protein [Planctomycetota bacterium]